MLVAIKMHFEVSTVPKALFSGMLRFLVVYLSLQALHGEFLAALPLRDGSPARADIPLTLDYEIPSPIYPRARVMSTDEMTAMIDRGGQLANKNSVFWTGYPYEDPRMPYYIARNWAREKFSQCGFAMYDNAWTDDDYRRINNADPNDPPTTANDELTIQHMSKAFARRSAGTVYVMVPDGQNPNPTSVWSVWEYPTLTRNQRVDKIIRVGWPSKREVPIWWRGNPPQGETAPPGK